MMLLLLSALVNAMMVGYDLGRVEEGYLPTAGSIVLTLVSVALMALSAFFHWQARR